MQIIYKSLGISKSQNRVTKLKLHQSTVENTTQRKSRKIENSKENSAKREKEWPQNDHTIAVHGYILKRLVGAAEATGCGAIGLRSRFTTVQWMEGQNKPLVSYMLNVEKKDIRKYTGRKIWISKKVGVYVLVYMLGEEKYVNGDIINFAEALTVLACVQN